MESFDRLNPYQYINLETFRRTGAGVCTPVWFVQSGDILYVRTVAGSGKVKRIRNNARINLAPCQADGSLLGEWQPASACELADPASADLVDRLLDEKYGEVKRQLTQAAAERGIQYTVLEIQAR